MTRFEKAILMSFLEAREEYLDAFWDEIDAVFGSFDVYVLQGLGLSAAQIDALTSRIWGESIVPAYCGVMTFRQLFASKRAARWAARFATPCPISRFRGFRACASSSSLRPLRCFWCRR